jgi:hypothetical protein
MRIPIQKSDSFFLLIKEGGNFLQKLFMRELEEKDRGGFWIRGPRTCCLDVLDALREGLILTFDQESSILSITEK